MCYDDVVVRKQFPVNEQKFPGELQDGKTVPKIRETVGG
jgi:hypothetical protein